jgi:hypothetical protein
MNSSNLNLNKMNDNIDEEDSLLEDVPSFWNLQKIYQSNMDNKQEQEETLINTNRRPSLAIDEFRMVNNVSPSQLMSLFKVNYTCKCAYIYQNHYLFN